MKKTSEFSPGPTIYETIYYSPTKPPTIKPLPTLTPTAIPTYKPVDWQSLTIPEDELITAINRYREFQGLSHLAVNEGFCILYPC